MSLFLNAPGAQRRVLAWAAAKIDCDVDCIHDSAGDTDDALHFVIVPRDGDERISLSADAVKTFASLGPAFQLEHENDANELHVYVAQPNEAQAAALVRAFKSLTAKMERNTWPFAVSGAMMLAGFIIFCCAFSGLHGHLHQYEAPWETFFEWAFSIPIRIGDALYSFAAGGAQEGAP